MAENSLSEMITASLQGIKEFAGTDTVVGNPILLSNGSTILPVSKILMGFASGGLDTQKKHESPVKPKNFTGGGGTGVSILPVAFLVASQDGRVDILPISSPKNLNTVDKVSALIEKSPEIISDLKEALTPEKVKEERRRRAFDGESSFS